MLSDPGFRELVSLPLSPAVLQGLARAGYSCLSEVVDLGKDRLASLCGVSAIEAQTAINVIQKYNGWMTNWSFDGTTGLSGVRTAWAMLYGEVDDDEQSVPLEDRLHHPQAVVSMCRSFDEVLGGGFPIGRLTELCGEPGVGKTQFCIQTCLTVQLPGWFGGLDGQAVFIDTEGNFVPRRARQMAEALVAHCRRHLSFADGHKPTDEERDRFCPSVDGLLSGIHYIRVTDHLQLMATSKRLAQFCSNQCRVRLIIVDSIALPFRYDFEDIPQRNRLLACLAQNLLGVANTQQAAVILTNQITTRIEGRMQWAGEDVPDSGIPSGSSVSSLVPALGESWGHICSVRIFLTRYSDIRRSFKLLKHPGRPHGSGYYRITSGGIRDCAT